MYPDNVDGARIGEELFPGSLKKAVDVSYLDENHPYILDLRGEGRMINSTLENLQSQLKGQNKFMAPLNDAYSFFKSQSMDNPEVRFNIKQNKINFKDSGGISEEYKLYGKILEREYSVLKLPPLTDEIINKPKLNAPLWVNVNKLLETKISELTDGNNNIEWQVLLAINLNDRSKITNIDYNRELNSLKEEKIQQVIDDEYRNFVNEKRNPRDADFKDEIIKKLNEVNKRRNEGGKEEFEINNDNISRLINQKIENEDNGNIANTGSDDESGEDSGEDSNDENDEDSGEDSNDENDEDSGQGSGKNSEGKSFEVRRREQNANVRRRMRRQGGGKGLGELEKVTDIMEINPNVFFTKKVQNNHLLRKCDHPMGYDFRELGIYNDTFFNYPDAYYRQDTVIATLNYIRNIAAPIDLFSSVDKKTQTDNFTLFDKLNVENFSFIYCFNNSTQGGIPSANRAKLFKKIFQISSTKSKFLFKCTKFIV